MANAWHKSLAEQRHALEIIETKRAAARMKRIYDKAQDELVGKLAKILKVGKQDDFTAFQHQQALAAIRAGQIELVRMLKPELHEQTIQAHKSALERLGRSVAALEKKFTGTTFTMPVKEIAQMSGATNKRERSLLRMHDESVNRYGIRNIERMESQMAISLAQGETPAQAVDRIAEVADDDWVWGERIVRCLPGETLVTGAVVRAVHRHWHEGAMVKVITERGSELTATPNHPMLTSRGWVPQGGIVPGDYLIRYKRRDHVSPSGNEHVARGPAMIREVFDAVAAIGIGERREARAPDFHGDGGKGDIHISRPDGKLVYGVFAPLSKPSTEHLFTHSDGRHVGFCPSCMGLLPYERACFCTGSDPYAHGSKPVHDHTVEHAHGPGDFWRTLAGLVTPSDLVDGQVDPFSSIPFGHASARSFSGIARNSGSAHSLANGIGRNAETRSYLDAAQAGDVELERVVHVETRHFSGHVFNLSTEDGYYSVNGYYTGNTEMSYAHNSAIFDGVQAAAQELPGLKVRWSEHCADDGTPLDSRVAVDSIAIHGQVTDAGGMFKMPPMAPVPDAKGRQDVPKQLVGKSWQFPPNRPNDRAVIQPWRSDWEIPGWEYSGGERKWLVEP